jgi:hypothetical protein
MRSFTIFLMATVCNVLLNEGEMDGRVARMGIKERVYKILVEQHDTKRPSRRLSVVGILRLQLVLMK